jgi:Na+/H+ antiporter NhaD/arsenite permease-like protein
MYPVTDVPMDATLWQLIAFCAGTGGSLLIIGSAAGVALMGLEKVDFLWYFFFFKCQYLYVYMQICTYILR